MSQELRQLKSCANAQPTSRAIIGKLAKKTSTNKKEPENDWHNFCFPNPALKSSANEENIFFSMSVCRYAYGNGKCPEQT